jgi:YHS domain-containing protein
MHAQLFSKHTEEFGKFLRKVFRSVYNFLIYFIKSSYNRVMMKSQIRLKLRFGVIKMILGNIVGILGVGLVLFLIISKIFKSGSCCGNHSSHGAVHQGRVHGSHVENDSQKQMQPSEKTVRDPICGMRIAKESALAKEINGVTYYFCCKSCAKKFEAEN